MTRGGLARLPAFIAVGILLTAQVQSATSQRSVRSPEPLHVINGVMHGRTISGTVPINRRATYFSFTPLRAEIKDGSVRLSGTFILGGSAAASEHIAASPVATLSRIANPWPGPGNQPLHHQSGECGVVFLKLELSTRLASRIGAEGPIQLGAVLSTIDNKSGEEISKRICEVLSVPQPSSEDVLRDRVSELNKALTTTEL